MKIEILNYLSEIVSGLYADIKATKSRMRAASPLYREFLKRQLEHQREELDYYSHEYLKLVRDYANENKE